MEDRAAESVLQGIARRCLGITALERYREHQEKLEKGKAGTATKTSGNSISPAG